MARYIDNPQKRDPYRNYNFHVYIQGELVAACNKVSGLSSTVESVSFRAGNARTSVEERMPGRTTYEDLTLEIGKTNDDVFKRWAGALMINEFTPGGPRASEPDFRADVEIHVLDIDQTVVKKFLVSNAWVKQYQTLSELNATGNEVLFESVTVVHEGFNEIAVA